MTLPELRKLCVDPFLMSQRRDPLMRSVEALCTTVSTALIRSEIWVDGSFLTRKIDPDDVDVLVILHSSAAHGTSEQHNIFRRIAQNDFTAPLPCHSFVLQEYPDGHPQYATYEVMRAYWLKQFCFNRREEIKGLAVVRTPIA
jgi:hypothetical protein